MKTFFKVITALAAVAGAVYVVATYGDEIVAWAKRLLASLPKCPCCNDADVIIEAEEDPIPDAPEAEEAPVEETAQEAPVEEAPVVPANEPVAEENDFAE